MDRKKERGGGGASEGKRKRRRARERERESENVGKPGCMGGGRDVEGAQEDRERDVEIGREMGEGVKIGKQGMAVCRLR